jgi:hypothetical protein
MRIKTILILLLTFISLSAQVTDRDLLDAYHREDMSIWKTYVDSVMANRLQVTGDYLLYEYGYCGYIVAEAKKEGKESLLPEAKRYVKQYKQHVEALKNQLPKGHYEMYQSAVYVYELRLHESIHPFNAMSLAKEATKLAPNDPLVLSYYGTCLFYSPKPFGSKSDALKWFEKAQPLFGDEQYTYCWVRKANEMYIQQCHDKLKK